MNVGVIFGGKSCEHDISVITGIQAIKAAGVRHKVIPVYIDEKGYWWLGKGLDDLKTVQSGLYKAKKVHLRPNSNAVYSASGKRLALLDAAVVACHGLNGEDGTVQGVLELSGIPYTGSNVTASAVGMDKAAMKKIFAAAGLPMTDYIEVRRRDYDERLYEIVGVIKEKLKFPLIVKPSNLGSSIGINVAKDWQQLFESIRVAFEWDNAVVIEHALTDFIEVNCGVLGDAGAVVTSEVEQPTGWKEFLTFQDKYGGGKSKGGSRNMPAQIPDEMRAEVRRLAGEAFRAAGCAGVARVDFLIEGDQIFVNEINTIPGSLANYLFSYGGMEFPDLIDKMLEIAFARDKDKRRLKYTYDRPAAKGK